MFNHMQLNPFNAKDGKMSSYKEFSKKVYWQKPEEGYDDFTKDDINALIKFAVLLVDNESPFYGEKDFLLRVKKCERVLYVDRNKRVKKEIEEMGDLLNNILFNFFKSVNYHIYETWMSMKINIHNMNMYLRKPPIPDKNGSVATDINARRNLSKTISELMHDLIEIEYQLFPDNRLQKIIVERSQEDGLGGYAEQFAKEPNYNS